MKRLSLMGLACVLVLVLTCAAWAGPAVDGIKKAGVLRIASTVTGVPATFMDTKSGKVVGIMVDVGQAIADHLGVKLEVVESPWAALIPSLQANKVNLICAAMYITEERKKVANFSEPVYPYCEALVVKASDKKNYTAIEDLKGLTMGAQVGTVYTKGLEAKGISVKVYDNIGDILLEISNGRIDGFLGDGPVAKYLVKTKPDFKVRVVESYKPVMCGDIGVGVNKDATDLLAEVNKVVAQLKSSGKMKQILDNWGGSN
jgi:polar amino acid transport system substrate-binding protein